jgi:hypothetical protein
MGGLNLARLGALVQKAAVAVGISRSLRKVGWARHPASTLIVARERGVGGGDFS